MTITNVIDFPQNSGQRYQCLDPKKFQFRRRHWSGDLSQGAPHRIARSKFDELRRLLISPNVAAKNMIMIRDEMKYSKKINPIA